MSYKRDPLRTSLWDCLCPRCSFRCSELGWVNQKETQCPACHCYHSAHDPQRVYLASSLSAPRQYFVLMTVCFCNQAVGAVLQRGLLSFVQNRSHRKMHKRCTSPGVMHQSILAMLGSFISIRLQELQLSFAKFPSFVLSLIKAQSLPGLIQHVRMKLSEQLWQGKKAGSFI